MASFPCIPATAQTKSAKTLVATASQRGTVSAKILLIQADPSEAAPLREALTNAIDGPFQVEWVRHLSEGLERLTADANNPKDKTAVGISAILVDLFLPDSRGIETFDRLFLIAPQIPILILCSSQDEEVAKLAVKRGAQDYLLKDRMDSYLLPKALRSMVERAVIADALFDEKERARITLSSIGDAVMSSDLFGQVTYLNAVAEGLTGWPNTEAEGHSLEEVFRIVDGLTGERMKNPMATAIRDNKPGGLTPNCVLIRRDGKEFAIEDSVAPIHDRHGRVAGAVMVFHDVTASRALSVRMSYLAQHDSLTDLPNRVLFSDRLTQAIALALRHRQKLAILYIDLDRFKHINDSLGHPIGDSLLRSVAQRLLACVRASDTLSRQGGDEFVILLQEVRDAQDAAVTADKILLAISAPHYIEQHELYVTGSIGIVIYPDNGTEVETLLRNADFAMYRAKEIGRNNHQLFKPDMNLGAIERQSLDEGLRHAAERHEFVLHYQPQMNLNSGAIVGAEALIRWHHPERGLVDPVQFIPVAEESGFIVPFGRWVLREACRQARAWQDAGLAPIRIAVNVSPVELCAKGYVAGVRAALLETGLKPTLLELELTETFLMQDSSSTDTVLQDLKAMGIQIALDDFGTGYSSLSYLRRFPIDTLKIDRSFVRDLTTDPDDASIVSAVISMGKSLRMRVVAEGVETPEQLACLKRRRCPEGQGHYFSKAVAPEEFSTLLGAHTTSAATME